MTCKVCLLETTDLGTMVKILPLSKSASPGFARHRPWRGTGSVHLDFGLRPFPSALYVVASTVTTTSNLPSNVSSMLRSSRSVVERILSNRSVISASIFGRRFFAQGLGESLSDDG